MSQPDVTHTLLGVPSPPEAQVLSASSVCGTHRRQLVLDGPQTPGCTRMVCPVPGCSISFATWTGGAASGYSPIAPPEGS